MKSYAVRDVKSASYANPFFSPNNQTATRAFAMEVNRQDAQNLLYTNHADFQLYYVGDFNPDTGVLSGKEPEYLTDGTAVLRQ
ncbi:nonstructural protein [robinz microvirus RP_121]|nr:nonstructural protein [robinz microvirus RP_121]